ncbi:hypothetical protein ACFOGJ_13355 [Marinibaculum pumilum]|uniref:General secretion pathway protein GspN n=1 Tax=Marinibaculum pumilum TaxID=1766165 RepID=A0ABV7L0Q0_9PROT
MPAFASSPGVALAWRAGLFGAAAAAFWWAISLPPVYPYQSTAAAPPAEAAPAAADPAGSQGAGSDSYPDIAAHPLFYPSRKPWTPPPPPPPPKADETPAAPPLNGYTLVGVVISGDRRSALIKEPSGSKTLVLETGHTLDGWRLQDVMTDKVKFESGKQTFELAFPRPAERKG